MPRSRSRMSLVPLLAAVAPLAMVGVLVAGCGSGDGSGSATPTRSGTSPGAGASPITITRTGGIAGVNQTLTIATDGSWTYHDNKTNTTERGTLSAAQLASLAGLATDSRLASEAAQPTGSGCADGFHYQVSIGNLKANFTDCGGNDRPAINAIIAELSKATPL